ncbi:MAG: hypothetical protein HOO86_00240 [Bacteroidales bacterium]|nr:hypothetical protein [Bacteroidales bacterium]
MKKILATVGLLIALVIMGCSKDNSPYSYPNESTIYSETNKINFRELLVILKPYTMVDNQKKYILTDSLFNVHFSVNGNEWGKFNSAKTDTTRYQDEMFNDFKVTDEVVKYPVIAPFQTAKDTLTTAGEYSDLLNAYFTLEPGFYICNVESFEFRDENGVMKKVETTIIEPVEIKENLRSAFIGEFEILINE